MRCNIDTSFLTTDNHPWLLSSVAPSLGLPEPRTSAGLFNQDPCVHYPRFLSVNEPSHYTAKRSDSTRSAVIGPPCPPHFDVTTQYRDKHPAREPVHSTCAIYCKFRVSVRQRYPASAIRECALSGDVRRPAATGMPLDKDGVMVISTLIRLDQD